MRAMRMRSQGLTGESRRWSSVDDVARGMLAMQAQDPRGVLWALSVRADQCPDEAVTLAAFAQGQVVRNRPSRGTLQVTAAEDMAWLSALLSRRSNVAAVKRRDQIGLTDQMLDTATGIVLSSLADGGVRTRAELVDACGSEGVALDGSQAGHLLRHLTETMQIVLTGPPGRVDHFAAGAPVAEAGRDLTGDDALAEVAVRYFGARGPATPQCLAWWANLTMGDTRRAIDAAGEALETVELTGVDFVVPAGSDAPSGTEVDSALAAPLLLAPFDEYLLGYRSRDAVITPERQDAVVPGRNGMFKPIVVVDGEVVGIWSRRATERVVTVTVEPFTSLDATSVDGLRARVDGYGAFLGLEGQLVMASVR